MNAKDTKQNEANEMKRLKTNIIKFRHPTDNNCSHSTKMYEKNR